MRRLVTVYFVGGERAAQVSKVSHHRLKEQAGKGFVRWSTIGADHGGGPE